MKEVKVPAVYHLVMTGEKKPAATAPTKAELEAWAEEKGLEAGKFKILEVSKPVYFKA